MTLEQINELVSEIQLLLGSETPITEEELMDLAGRHDELVQGAVKRLHAVDGLLQKGLRSEAIELAEREPNLNEVVIALDFPELDAWNELLSSQKMQIIPAIPAEIATELNDAYSVSAPLERLLQKHRTAALGRAPLSQRLMILRKLAAADPGNPAWSQDVQSFEKHRLDEIRVEAEAAIREKDPRGLAVLDQELNGTEWRANVPPDLKRRVADAHGKALKVVSHTEMEKLAYDLSDTYAAFDLEAAKPLSQRFHALNEIVGLNATDPLFDIAGPALDWVREELDRADRETRFQNTILAIEQGIDQGASAAELERLQYQATQHGDLLPERLQVRLADRLETLRVAASRRRGAIIVFSCLAVVLVITATGLLVREVAVRNSIAQHKTQLAVLFADAESSGLTDPLEEYFRLLAEEPVSVAESAELIGLRQQFESLKLKESGRQGNIETLLDEVKSGLEKITRPGDCEEIRITLAEAVKLVKNDDERRKVRDAEFQINTAEAQLQKQIDDAFSAELNRINERIGRLPQDDVADYDTILTEIDALAAVPDVTPTLVETVRSLRSKVHAERREVSTRLEVARQLLAVTNAVGNPAVYSAELIRYSEQFPGTSRSTGFELVSRTELKLCQGALRWNEIRDRLEKVDFAVIDSDSAKKLVDDFNEFQRTSGPYPGEMNLGPRLRSLQSVAKRKTLLDTFKEVFDGKAVSSAWMIETPDGEKRYYSDAAPLVNKHLIFDYYTAPAGNQTVQLKLSLLNFPDAEGKTRDDWLSPQTKLYRSIQHSLEQPRTRDFEKTILELASRILSEEPRMDPILRMLLVEKLIESGSEGSHFISERATVIQPLFAEGGVPRLTNWLDLEDNQVRKTRDIAVEFLQKNARRIEDVLVEAVKDRDSIQTMPVGPAVQWIGWLARDDTATDKWEVRIRSDLSIKPGNRLCCFASTVPGMPPQMLSIGSLEDGRNAVVAASIEESDPLEGRPVFLLVDLKE